MWVPPEVPGKQGVTIRVAFESDGVPFWVHVFFIVPNYWDISALEKPTGYANCRYMSIVFVNISHSNTEMSLHTGRSSAVSVGKCVKPSFGFSTCQHAICGKVLNSFELRIVKITFPQIQQPKYK